jgi:hypothetical protein
MVWIKTKEITSVFKPGKDIKLTEKEAKQTEKEKTNFAEMEGIIGHPKITHIVEYRGEINSSGRGIIKKKKEYLK